MNRFHVVYGFLLMLLTACGGSSPSPVASPPPQPVYDLVFAGTQNALSELLTFDETSGTVSRVLPAGTVVADPRPSPDGTRIAFVVSNSTDGTGDIFVINRDGTGLRQLTFDPELDDQPAWSPDGRRIAFRSFRSGYFGDIWIMNADGSNQVNLTPDPLPAVTSEYRPAWSPDGTKIVYGSNQAGDSDLWTMNADGSGKHQLTGSMDFDTEPAWSPDGTTIAFRRSNAATGSEISLVPATGGTVQALVLPGEQRMPVWSPDGRSIVFVSHLTMNARPDLYRMRPDGTAVEALVTSQVSGGSLSPGFLKRP